MDNAVTLKTINPNARVRYVLKRQRELPEAQQCVWTWRPLTALDHFELWTNRPAALATEQLRRATVKVENLRAPDGPVDFTLDADGFCARGILERMELADLIELATERVALERLTVEDAGKS